MSDDTFVSATSPARAAPAATAAATAFGTSAVQGAKSESWQVRNDENINEINCSPSQTEQRSVTKETARQRKKSAKQQQHVLSQNRSPAFTTTILLCTLVFRALVALLLVDSLERICLLVLMMGVRRCTVGKKQRRKKEKNRGSEREGLTSSDETPYR
jgi:Flp pilus assembly protein TadB